MRRSSDPEISGSFCRANSSSERYGERVLHPKGDADISRRGDSLIQLWLGNQRGEKNALILLDIGEVRLHRAARRGSSTTRRPRRFRRAPGRGTDGVTASCARWARCWQRSAPGAWLALRSAGSLPPAVLPAHRRTDKGRFGHSPKVIQ